MGIDGSGRVIIGPGNHAGGSQLVIKGGGTNTYSTLGMFSNHTNPAHDTLLSQIRFGSNATAVGADIRVYSVTDWASNDYPTRMSFYTTPDGSNSRQERLRISSDGHITAPNNVAFSARGGPADLTNDVIIFATQVFQRGGTNYSTSTGIFTAPVAGIYHFMCNPYRYTDSNDSALLLETSTNGGSSWSTQIEIRNMNNYLSDSGRGWFTLSLSQLIDLNKDDQVRVKAVSRIHCNGVYSRFSGFLVA